MTNRPQGYCVELLKILPMLAAIIYPLATAGNLSLYWFDDELPTTLFGQYDEDFWQVSVPVLSAINTSLYWVR